MPIDNLVFFRGKFPALVLISNYHYKWVKGKTENDLIKLLFKKVYNFRPGVLQPTKGLKNTLGIYKYLGWLLPVIRLLAPKHITSLQELGLAMINSVTKGYEKQILEVKDILALSKE